MEQQVVSSAEGQHVTFRKAKGWGGIEDHLGTYKEAALKSDSVEFVTTTLTSILDRARAPQVIDFMSIDIEGAELEALKGLDFSKYRVGAFAIEHNFEEPKRTQIRQLLEEHGYRLARTIEQDDCFVLADRGAGTKG